MLLDNASVHGTQAELPTLSNVTVHYLPKKTTSILQPLDAGVIASIKKRYMQRVVERGVDLIEEGVINNAYNVDLKTALKWLYQIWNELDDDLVRNCWVKTNILD